MLFNSLFLNKFFPIDDEEILNPSFAASILNVEIFIDDLDGIAKLIVPIRKAKTIKITANSISYLIKNVLNNLWSIIYKTCINLHKLSTSIYFNIKVIFRHYTADSNNRKLWKCLFYRLNNVC